MSNYFAVIISEGSSHQGLIVTAAAVAVLFFAVPLTKVILWGALAWGVWSMMKKD